MKKPRQTVSIVDLHSEQYGLGCVLSDPACASEFFAVARPSDFAGLGPLADLISRRLHNRQPLDEPALLSALQAANVTEINGQSAIETVRVLTATASNPTHAGLYAASIRKLADKRRAVGFVNEAARRLAEADGESPAVIADLYRGFGELAAEIDNPGGLLRPVPITAAELCERYKEMREPIIDGLLRRGEVGNIVAPPKMNKTWFNMYCALSVVSGRSLLDRFPTRAGRVLLLDYELSPGTLAKRLQAVVSAMGLTLADIGNRLEIVSLRGKRLDLAGLGLYFSTLSAGQYDLIIIDPLYRMFPKDFDENSNADMADLYATLQGYAESLSAALIVVHHMTKGNQADKGVTDLGAGGGSQSRAADAHLALRPHAVDGAAVLSGVVRSFPPFEPVAMRWEYPLWKPAPDLDPAELKKAVGQRRAKTEEPKKTKLAPTVEEFAKRFVKAKPQTEASILIAANAAGLKDSAARKLLRAAVDDGLAHLRKTGHNAVAKYSTEPPTLLTEGQT